MLLQRLSTGATGVKQARYRRGPTRAARHSYAHAQYIHSLYSVVHNAYEFRRGCCTLVLSLLVSNKTPGDVGVGNGANVYPSIIQ